MNTMFIRDIYSSCIVGIVNRTSGNKIIIVVLNYHREITFYQESENQVQIKHSTSFINKDCKIAAFRICFGFLLGFIGMGCGASAVPSDERPSKWAQPVKKEGLPNLHQINDSIYRGAQPSIEGFKTLRRMGISTIVNLRAYHHDTDEIKTAGLEDKFKIIEIPADAWDVSEEEVIAFLRVIEDSSNHPIFFHCKHGADRTGTMAAIYRMYKENWTSEDALKEMTQGGYGFHTIWKNLPEFVKQLDMAQLKRELKKGPH